MTTGSLVNWFLFWFWLLIGLYGLTMFVVNGGRLLQSAYVRRSDARKNHAEPKSMRRASCKLMRVEKVISEMQSDGRNIQWRLHLSGGPDETLKWNVSDNVASGLQEGSNVKVEFTITPMGYIEPA